MKLTITPTSHRRDLNANDFIVTKTDIKGRITYANRIFMSITGFSETELLGVQHHIIRHPDMPRGVFKFLWDTLKSGDEFLGFVKNLCADGGYYWVFANITPDYNKEGKLQGYYSVRRKPPQSALNIIIPIYQDMLAIEKRATAKKATTHSLRHLMEFVEQSEERDYNRLILNLYNPNKI